MEKNYKIDVIVPIYNCENYLTRCMNTLLSQEVSDNLSIILVNDGSTDNSGIMAEKYAEAYSNVILVNKKNGGLSSARNAGMGKITGDYFTFVDPDDWVGPSYFNKVLNQLNKQNVDILMVPYIRWYKGHQIKQFVFNDQITFFNKEETRSTVLRRLYGLTDDELTNPLTVDNLSPVWSKFYKSSKFRSIRFTDKSEIYSEDLWFNIKCFVLADSSEFFNGTYYYYYKGNNSSIVHTFDKNMLKEYKRLYKYMFKCIEDYELDFTFIKSLRNRIVLNELSILRNAVSSNISKSLNYKRIKTIINDPLYNKVFLDFNYRKLPIAYKLFYKGCEYKLPLILYFALRTGEKLKTRMKQ